MRSFFDWIRLLNEIENDHTENIFENEKLELRRCRSGDLWQFRYNGRT